MHGAKYRHVARDVRRRLRQLGVHRRRRRRRRSASTASASTSPTPASTQRSRPRGRQPGRRVRAHRRDARAAQEPRERDRRRAAARRRAARRRRARLGRRRGAGSRCHLARLSVGRRAAGAVPRCRRVRLPLALRGLRHPGARGDGLRRRRASSRRIRRSTRRAATLPCAPIRTTPRRSRRRSSRRAPSATSSCGAASRTRDGSRWLENGTGAPGGVVRDEGRHRRHAARPHARRNGALSRIAPARASSARRPSSGCAGSRPARPATLWLDLALVSARPATPAQRAPTCCTARPTAGPSRSSVPLVVTVHDLAVFRHPEAFPPLDAHLQPRRRSARRSRARGSSRRLRVHRQASSRPCCASRRERIRVVPNAVDGGVLGTRARPRWATTCSRSGRSSRARTSRARSRRRSGSAWSCASSARAAGAASRSRGDGVRWEGEVGDEQLARLYRGALCVAYPSLYEGFGIPVLEAMACGAPVVTTRGGATEEVAGGAAVLVDPRGRLRRSPRASRRRSRGATSCAPPASAVRATTPGMRRRSCCCRRTRPRRDRHRRRRRSAATAPATRRTSRELLRALPARPRSRGA